MTSPAAEHALTILLLLHNIQAHAQSSQGYNSSKRRAPQMPWYERAWGSMCRVYTGTWKPYDLPMAWCCWLLTTCLVIVALGGLVSVQLLFPMNHKVASDHCCSAFTCRSTIT